MSQTRGIGVNPSRLTQTVGVILSILPQDCSLKADAKYANKLAMAFHQAHNQKLILDVFLRGTPDVFGFGSPSLFTPMEI